MMKLRPFLILLIFLTNRVYGVDIDAGAWKYASGNFHFEWNFNNDKAFMFQSETHDTLWKGSLLPAFWLQDAGGHTLYVKSQVINETTDNDRTILDLRLPGLGKGKLVIIRESWGIAISELEITWDDVIPKIVDLYFGTSPVPEGRQSVMDKDGSPFSSDWDAFGYCIPGAKEGTVQSFFRMWDFGQADIALGSFAPSMSIPYGAAFPRPVLSVAMGNDKGWMLIGAGSLPDAPMTLKMRSSLGSINFCYREDLWGAGGKVRAWSDLFRIVFAESAWNAYQQYFNTYPEKQDAHNGHQQAIWNTWGNWRNKEYPIHPMVDFASQVKAETFVIDDPWEASQGLGKPDTVKFPQMFEDVDYMHTHNMSNGIWECMGWIGDTAACGLTKEDLICDKHGNPCVASWNFNPFAPGYFCIDLSSPRSREFLKARTVTMMKMMKPSLIKLDFGYGMPNPNIGVPREPALRGEKYSFELMKIIRDAAKSVDPSVTIMYYSIHPVFLSLTDLVSLDDQGDMWYAIKEGHSQWSIWASLLSDRHVAISGSSSYDWHTDDEVILNTFILGSPGSVLGTHLDDSSPVPEKYLNRRLAINQWYRRTVDWEPLWLNSTTGNMVSPPVLNCWGRTEMADGKKILTSLILRGKKDSSLDELQAFVWEGRWALVSLDAKGILEAERLALVPFDPGFISISLSASPEIIEKVNIQGTTQFRGWQWEKGVLTVRLDQQDLDQTAGFIIRLKK